MLLLGIDLGTSSIKVAVVDAESRKTVAEAQFPESETDIISVQAGWAEQSPEQWWEHVKLAILKSQSEGNFDPADIAAIGIAYQMHGLVMIDDDQQPLRNSIIWCDSRAVEIGDKAFQKIGRQNCLKRHLNSPGNFTASKLAWVKSHEPEIYQRVHKILLPGDFIAMKLTGEVATTPSAMSEGIFWDFPKNTLSQEVLDNFRFDQNLFPDIRPVFSVHGTLTESNARQLRLHAGIPVTYKAGDQLNNALSLNVMQPGEVAATAGTSGVIYGITDHLSYDEQSRINSFAHINHTAERNRIGVLLCINGAGIFNRWMRDVAGPSSSYEALDLEASKIKPGSDGLIAIPFGNGAERMLNNNWTGAAFENLDLNVHSRAHLVRSVQEGIAFAFRYGLDIMSENGMSPGVIRAGKSNMFQSPVFRSAFVNATGIPLELHDVSSSAGAALGAGIGAGFFSETALASGSGRAEQLLPDNTKRYDELYQNWRDALRQLLEVRQRN